jgi:KDO2-lipid IV(A) lauroyltransferase
VRKSPIRYIRYAVEAMLVYPLYFFSWVLPTSLASAVGAVIGSVLYYAHPGSRRAVSNLQKTLPDRAAEHSAIVRGMWRNLGRVVMEYPHLSRIWSRGRVAVEGMHHTLPYQGQACIFVAAHMGNWECIPMVAQRSGWRLATIYRPLNNPFVDPLLRYARRTTTDLLFTKSTEGAMALIRHVRGGGSAGVLMDQRLGDGISVPFFGLPALSPPLAATLAVKYGVIIFPVRMERLGGSRFRATVHPPINPPTDGGEPERIRAVTASVYQLFEEWIRARPEQWLWLHDRWRQK